MNELVEQYKAQIEALQKEVQKKDNCLQEAKKLLNELLVVITEHQSENK